MYCFLKHSERFLHLGNDDSLLRVMPYARAFFVCFEPCVARVNVKERLNVVRVLTFSTRFSRVHALRACRVFVFCFVSGKDDKSTRKKRFAVV